MNTLDALVFSTGRDLEMLVFVAVCLEDHLSEAMQQKIDTDSSCFECFFYHLFTQFIGKKEEKICWVCCCTCLRCVGTVPWTSLPVPRTYQLLSVWFKRFLSIKDIAKFYEIYVCCMVCPALLP